MMKKLSALVLLCLIVSSGVEAEDDFYVSKSSSGATVSLTLGGDYSSIASRIRDDLVDFLTPISNTYAVYQLADGVHQDIPSTFDSSIQRTRTRIFTARTLFKGALPESLFLINETETICPDNDPMSFCTQSLSLTLDGPVKVYRSVREPRTVDYGQLLRGSFSVSFSLSGTSAQFTMAKTGSGYQDLIRHLFEKGKIETLPTDDQIVDGFVAWAKRNLTKLKN